jgi:hypothetical protein
MNNITKLGIIISILALSIRIILTYLLHQEVPNFITYIFYGGIYLSFVGIIIQGSKNKQS